MENFVVYKSSAGSGKTFTLVKEYLRLALCEEKKLSYNYKRILAVTFTNKAASEMKSRVIEALNQISYNQSLPFIGQLLSDELQLSAEELKKRSNYVLNHILHHYSDFSIGTIDSFTHKIVKTFAHDLKLPVNFTIEMDTQGFYEKVIASLFNKIGEDEYVSKLLKDYALNKAEDNAAWDPETQIQEFAKLLQKENSGEYIEKLKQFSSDELEAFRKQFLDFTKHYKTTLKTEAKKALELIRKNKLNDSDFYHKAAGPQSFFKKCIDNSVNLESTIKGRIIDAVTNNKWSNTDGSNKSILDSITNELNTLAKSLLNFISENYTYFSLCELLSKQMYPLMLLKKIEEISLEQKQEERLVFISEFNHKIFEIINNEPTPFIYERLGERYQHYLLDEFQDTSSLQWHNILPLLDNSLSNGWFNLIVGDGKQSIYRWRNANVKQFASLPDVENKDNNYNIDERAQALERNYSGKVLNTNFRSLKTIVEFNNAFFESLSNKLLSEESQTIYKDQLQLIKNPGEGYISIHYGKTEREQLDSFNCETIKEQILKAVRDGFAYKDICILARKNYHGNNIANYLVEQKIPVVSSDSLLLKNNLEINTIVSYLNYLVNRQDAISGAAVLNYLFQIEKINAADYHTYLTELSKNNSLFSIFKKVGIQLSEGDLSLNNLFDNCIEIIRALDLTKKGYHYVRFFLDEVNEFLVQKNSNISSFFDWWKSLSNRASMIIPENTDAVRIMTIHASKGLEFPVVIIPYCNWQIYKANDSWVNVKNDQIELPVGVINLSKKVSDSGFELEFETEKQEQLLDNLNLLYVAFTRAIERLHIIATSSITNKHESVSDWLYAFVGSQNDDTSENIYELGTTLTKQSKHSTSSLTQFALEPLNFNTNKNTIQIKASYLNNNEHNEEAKQQGLLIHWLLSKIRTSDDQTGALQSALLEGIVSKEEIPDLNKKLKDVLQHPELSTYFAPNISCKLEAELVTQTGDLLRPDRIVFNENETILIDYKTGKENNKTYFKQLYKYEAALMTMGYTNIKKLLVYVDEVKVVEVN
ncbi:UvrD-helicase domain-containing protein [Aurantibacillus circumpalustris]|uniref:UvrD-helicase domain-containing protein n=1 Tax=Aurantibacillus circumpalustris TaxID=3036359 RepID=UPI00295AEA67|nr:UvrD-helicase domain-containing protein [Aurantibacillus circumpalustris]